MAIQADFPKKIIPLCYFSYFLLCGESFCCVPGGCAGFIPWFWKERNIAWAQPGGICHLTGNESSDDSKDWSVPVPWNSSIVVRTIWGSCSRQEEFGSTLWHSWVVAGCGLREQRGFSRGAAVDLAVPAYTYPQKGVPGTSTELQHVGFSCRCKEHPGLWELSSGVWRSSLPPCHSP